MNYFQYLPLVLISCISCFYLITSIQPGKLEYFLEEQTLLILMSQLMGFLFFLAVVGNFIVFKFKKKTSDQVPTILKRPNNWAMVILLVTVFLMYFHIPVKLAFASSYSGFQEAVAMPTNQQVKKIGLYKVELIERTPAGEVFFPTYIFWATAATSWHGFAYKPDLQCSNQSTSCGTKFGPGKYTHLFGDWYIFHGATC